MPGMAVMPAKRPRTQDTRRSTNDVSITDLVGSRWQDWSLSVTGSS